MADDLRRWLEGEPIRARRLGPIERVTRWCRRNPAVAGLIAAVALVLVVGALTSTFFALQAESRRTEAVARASEARKAQELAARNAAEAKARAAEAVANATKARDAREIANRKAQESLASAEEARQAQATAKREADRARDEKLTSDRRLYAAQINLAQRAWEDGQFNRTQELLDGQEPERTGGIDLRGWEWRYLKRLSSTELATLRGHADTVSCVAFSPDGSRLASGGFDRAVRIWHILTGELQHTLTIPFAEAERDPGVQRTNSVHAVTGIALSPDGSRLAVACNPGWVSVWDIKTGKMLALKDSKGIQDPETKGDSESPARSGKGWSRVVYTLDGKWIAANLNGTLSVLDSTTLQALPTFDSGTSTRYGLAISPDGALLATGALPTDSENGNVMLSNARTGRSRALVTGFSEEFVDIAFSPDGLLLATGGSDGLVKLFNAANGHEVSTLRGHTRGVYSVAFSADGARLASAGDDESVRIWDVKKGQEIFTLLGHTRAVRDVTFSPDGTRIATASEDRTVKLWDTTSGRELTTHALARGSTRGQSRSTPKDQTRRDADLASTAVVGLAFSRDGKQLTMVRRDTTVKVWDVETGRVVRQETAQPIGTSIISLEVLALSPDATVLAIDSFLNVPKEFKSPEINEHENLRAQKVYLI
jgi:WD40 repeat protein